MKALAETRHKGSVHNTKSILNTQSKAAGVASNANSKHNTSLPFSLQTKMEKSFGQNLSDVTIHKNSSKALQMKSLAFTQGNNIHFAPGQFNPGSERGRHLIGHEFTHVMQQRSGTVKATDKVSPGLQLNADHALEREADVLGKRAVNGQTVSQYQGSKASHGQTGVIQRKKITTFGGDWSTDKFKLIQDQFRGAATDPAMGYRGADIKIRFKPKENADAEMIGLTQTITMAKQGAPYSFNPLLQSRSISNADAVTTNGRSDEGAYIDRVDSYNNPIYPVQTQPSTSLDDNNTSASWGQNGWKYKRAGSDIERDALLLDTPSLHTATINAKQEFETAALATRGAHAGTYYGSVKWGWETDSLGNHTPIEFDEVSNGLPSSTFMQAGELWNNSQSSLGSDTVDLPVQWMGTVHNTPSLALRTGPSTENTLIADIPGNAAVTVMDDSSSWLQVQLDTTQPGVNLNATGRSQLMTGNLLRGYVSGSYISKDADYAR